MICLHRVTVWNMAGSFSYWTSRSACITKTRSYDSPFVRIGHIMTSRPTTSARGQRYRQWMPRYIRAETPSNWAPFSTVSTLGANFPICQQHSTEGDSPMTTPRIIAIKTSGARSRSSHDNPLSKESGSQQRVHLSNLLGPANCSGVGGRSCSPDWVEWLPKDETGSWGCIRSFSLGDIAL
jgi:hypothetical protein